MLHVETLKVVFFLVIDFLALKTCPWMLHKMIKDHLKTQSFKRFSSRHHHYIICETGEQKPENNAALSTEGKDSPHAS